MDMIASGTLYPEAAQHARTPRMHVAQRVVDSTPKFPSIHTGPERFPNGHHDWQCPESFWRHDIVVASGLDPGQHQSQYQHDPFTDQESSMLWFDDEQLAKPADGSLDLPIDRAGVTVPLSNTYTNCIHAMLPKQVDDTLVIAQDGRHQAPSKYPHLANSKYEDVPHRAAPTDDHLQDEHNKQADGDEVKDVIHNRKSRSHDWPPVSDPWPTISFPRHFETRTIGHTGCESGRNLLAIFEGTDARPRTRYNLRILRGRGSSYLPEVHAYPAYNTTIPACQTLEQICRQFPRHVWGTGLRMFVAEGWTGESIYNALPEDFRDSKAVQRPWNYIQQGFTREVKRMNVENGVHRQVQKRKRMCSDVEPNENIRRLKALKSGSGSESPDAICHTRTASTLPSTAYANNISESKLQQYPRLPTLLANDSPVVDKENKSSTDIAEELHSQNQLLLKIMQVLHPDLCTEPDSKRQKRVHLARASIFNDFGSSIDCASSNDVEAFTTRLQELVASLSVPYRSSPDERLSRFAKDMHDVLDEAEVAHPILS